MSSDDAVISSPPFRRVSRLWRIAQHWSGWLLAGYALAQFTGTHWPNPPAVIPIEGNDKFLHWGAYFGLAFLMTTWLSARIAITRRVFGLIWTLTAGLAVIDELTQLLPGVNRHCDLSDWIADVIGSACGLMTWHFLQKKLFTPRETTASEPTPAR